MELELQIYRNTAKKYPTYKEFVFPDGAYDFVITTQLDGTDKVEYKYDGFVWIFYTSGTLKKSPKRRRHIPVWEAGPKQDGKILHKYQIPSEKWLKRQAKKKMGLLADELTIAARQMGLAHKRLITLNEARTKIGFAKEDFSSEDLWFGERYLFDARSDNWEWKNCRRKIPVQRLYWRNFQ